jgi:4-amino-4-deoxy-L-arabinose transferase-like glycosyltransferase
VSIVASPVTRRQRLVALLSSEWVLLGSLLLLALMVRLAFHFRSPAFVGKDSQSYFLPGWELARAEPFDLGQRRTPGYPLFIAGVILALGEELRSLALAQHFVGVATVGVTYLLGRIAFGRSTALAAGLLVALNGSLLIYERYVMSEALFTFLLSLTVLAAVLAVRHWRPPTDSTRTWQHWRWLLVGLACGFAVLARPVAQVVLPLLVLTIMLAAGRNWRASLLGLAALTAGLLLVQGPWVLRNAIVKGNVAASTFGRTLIARTAYYDREFVFAVPGQPHPDPFVERARQIVQEGAKRRDSDGEIAGRLRQELDLDPVQVNQVMRDIAVAAILRNPVHYAEGSIEFVGVIFAGEEERLRDHWDEYKDANPWDPRIRDLVGGPTSAELAERSNANRLANLFQPARYSTALAALFILGAALALLVPRYRVALLPSATVGVLLLAQAALDGPVERYRYPVDPLIALVAAGGLLGTLSLLLALVRARAQLSPDPRQPAIGLPATAQER